MATLHLTADQDGERYDQFLARQLPELSRCAAQRLLEQGAVTREGALLRKNDRTTLGDLLTLVLPDPVAVEVTPQNLPLDVVYEDEDVIAINKSIGMVVHPAPGHPDGTLVNALLYHCGNSLSGINGILRPGIVHRIDRDTSGLILAAKNDIAHLALAQQLQDHTLYREYHAVAVGGFREDGGTVNAPIARHHQDRKRMAVNFLHGREAITHWTLLERLRGCAYLQCRLETGRTHQIRVHMAYLGHPLLGDPVYGTAYTGLTGQCLHARVLSFCHPRTGERMTLECAFPVEFKSILAKLRTSLS